MQSECMPWRTLARVQLSPSSALIITPWPIVPTRMVPLFAMAHLLTSSEPFRLSRDRDYTPIGGAPRPRHHKGTETSRCLGPAGRRPVKGLSSEPSVACSGGNMRAWTVDADDIRVAEDFDESLLHRTPEIDSFLTPDRDDKFIVIATKGFGKTLLLKAKRILYQRES